MKRILILFYLLLITVPAFCEIRDENLLQNLPADYKVGYQQREGDMLMVEMVPKNEAVQNWSEMLTTQVFFGNLEVSPQGFYDLLAGMLKNVCPDAKGRLVRTGEENGYPFALGKLTCPSNPTTGKPEYILMKTIKGNDSFYAVQKAWRREPKKEEIAQWTHYLEEVVVCDTRIPDRACPKVSKLE